MAHIISDKPVTATSSLFAPLPFFMLRMPLLPMKSFCEIQKGDSYIDSLQKLLKNSYVKEAIAVASPRLYEALPHLVNRSDERKTKQAASSVLKYLSRMSTRPTPFGLFAGVTAGYLAKKTDVRMNAPKYYTKRTRPDMEWLLLVVKRLEERLDVVKQLRVTRNHAVQCTGSRMEFLYPTLTGQAQNGENGQDDKISVRATPPAMTALELAAQPILFEDLVHKLTGLYQEGQEAGEQVITNFVWTLFSKEFLISELRPPLTIPSPLEYLLERLEPLKGVDEEKRMLTQVQSLIRKYDDCPLGGGLEIYQEMTEYMKQYGETKSAVQVDLALSRQNLELHQSVGEEAARVGEILWLLSQAEAGFPHIKEYHGRFLEKYGDCCDVPILELLNEETGLGVPPIYLNPQANYKEENAEKARKAADRQRLIMDKVAGVLLHRQMELELTDELIDQLIDKDKDINEAPESFEIYTEVLASSPEALNRGDYLLVLGPNPGSFESGSTFGRFLDMFDDGIRDSIKNIQHRQQQYQPETIFAEAAFIPKNGRIANVMLTSCLRDYEIAIGTNSDKGKTPLTVDDIVVCATHDRLYLKSRSLGKKIIVTAGHMLNFQQGPHIYRFMRELSFEGVRLWQPFDWGLLEQSVFLPRLRYGRTILSPAKWNLYLSNYSSRKQIEDDNEWYGQFEAWKREWSVPRYVYMVVADNRILLDLDNTEFVDEVRKELLANGHVTLHEMVRSFDERWVTGAEGSYNIECVFQLEKKERVIRSLPVSPLVKTCPKEEQMKLPGSDWIFAKLYGGQDRQDEFIVNAIYEFSETMIQKKYANQWFFMRYQDPAPHIRLRFRGEPEVLVEKLMPALHDWSRLCVREGLIQKLVLDTYEREVGRYGGPALISDAEQVFFADSRTAVPLIRLLRYGNTDWPNYIIASISAIQIMNQFGLPYSEQLDLLNGMIDKNEYRKEYRTWRRELMDILGSEHWNELRNRPNGEAILQSFEQRSPALQHYAKRMANEHLTQHLWNPIPNIISSMMHMHFNRLLGIDRELEKKSLAYAGHTLDGLLQYWKHKKRG
ncbi:lantibiotic dehydratase [Paenibacillus zanthoxyli]|uniref:lantibiotic dehydratase n=1 Tax=Paenibacillus zanthoxyli TaxID=369399 RepID=UPI000470EF6C|nr:lantibiotic dehydratase [Paenibacillus zanthoxyli]